MIVVRLRGLLVAGACASLAWVLWTLRGTLGTPAVDSWDSAERWYEAVGPVAAIVASVRVVALGAALWLALAAVLEVVAATHPWSGVRTLADAVAPRSLQRLMHGLAGLSLTAGLAVPAPSAGILAGGGHAVSAIAPVEPSEGGGTATMHLIDEPAVEQPVVDSTGEVTVRPGDSFWSIAEEALRIEGVSSPGDAEVARYWRRVIEQNRAALVDPTTPDLIYAGQVFTLPRPEMPPLSPEQ